MLCPRLTEPVGRSYYMKDLTEIQNKIKIDSIEKLEFTDEQILENFFIENKIDSYTEKFKNEKVFSAELLKDLTDEDLLKLGLATLGDRKRMLKLFQGNELNNFRNLLLYKNVDKNELEKIDIKENEILKQNKCKFKYMSADTEKGELTLYCNRIVWKGYLNEFTIAIIDITDAMMIAMCVPNVIVLYILAPEIKKDLKDYLETHNFPLARKLVKF